MYIFSALHTCCSEWAKGYEAIQALLQFDYAVEIIPRLGAKHCRTWWCNVQCQMPFANNPRGGPPLPSPRPRPRPLKPDIVAIDGRMLGGQVDVILLLM